MLLFSSTGGLAPSSPVDRPGALLAVDEVSAAGGVGAVASWSACPPTWGPTTCRRTDRDQRAAGGQEPSRRSAGTPRRAEVAMIRRSSAAGRSCSTARYFQGSSPNGTSLHGCDPQPVFLIDYVDWITSNGSGARSTSWVDYVYPRSLGASVRKGHVRRLVVVVGGRYVPLEVPRTSTPCCGR
ncbi:hypothetical protein HBB16_17955 [Pseudonocardia sp. MCCB 268]|nr:hypothetical protein [Pseudonocardia cytotoxica]